MENSKQGVIHRAPALSALGMVKSVEITNFRGFESLRVDGLERINVIVGDNGAGKTAFLESIFLTLGGHLQGAMGFRHGRGQNAAFNAGSGDAVVESVFSDLFHDSSLPSFSVVLTGRGAENRRVKVSKTRGDVLIPTKGVPNRHEKRKAKKIRAPIMGDAYVIPIDFTWTDEHGAEHKAQMKLSPATGLMELGGTGEPLPESYLFNSQNPVPPGDSAKYYSVLKRRREIEKFRSAFMAAFYNITDISVDTDGASDVLVVDVATSKRLLPLPVYSGGTNRMAAILLAIPQREHGLVMVDEVENGIFHARHEGISKALIELSRAYDTQLIMTSHSDEWLESFISAALDKSDDIAFWRMERDKEKRPSLRKFSLVEFKSGMAGGEMR